MWKGHVKNVDYITENDNRKFPPVTTGCGEDRHWVGAAELLGSSELCLHVSLTCSEIEGTNKANTKFPSKFTTNNYSTDSRL